MGEGIKPASGCQSQDTFLAIQEDILLRIVDIVKEAGSGFAYPSQTAYIGRDTGLDAEQGCRAETRVREWRAKGMLPFPEFGDEQRRELEDVLDYPPKGSPDNPTPHSRVETEPTREGEDPTSSEGEPQ